MSLSFPDAICLLSSFFNFFKNTVDAKLQNPCDTPTLRKLFRERKATRWQILEKEVVDEIIFRTQNLRNRAHVGTDGPWWHENWRSTQA